MRATVLNRLGKLAALVAVLAAPLLAPIGVHASPYTEIASAFDEGDEFDLHTSITYQLVVRRTAIKREFVGLPGTGIDDPLPIAKDLLFSSTRHELVPRIELGFFTDLSIAVSLPIVLFDSRKLEFDQNSTPCTFPADPGPATCINATNSTTIVDGLLPTNGFDADDPNGPGFTGNNAMIFRGVDRSGLDQVHLGLAWAAMNQARDPTKPTWKLGAEVRLSVGSPMKFDRLNPDNETGVSRGVHEIRLWTSMVRRLTWAEPYFDIWYMATYSIREDSQFDTLPTNFGAERTSPMQRAGTNFGFEAIVWEKKAAKQRVGIDAHLHLEGHFEGRDYTDMWEVIAYAGHAPSGGPLTLDQDPVQMGVQALSHPGVTNVENYLTIGGSVGINVHLGEKVRFGANFTLDYEQSHLISFADAGEDLPTCGSGEAPPGCETSVNDLVNQGTEEVNPLNVPLVDATGHRYRVDNARNYVFGINARFLF